MFRLLNLFIPNNILKSDQENEAQFVVFTSLIMLVGILYSSAVTYRPLNAILIIGSLTALLLTYISNLYLAKYTLLTSGWVSLTWLIYTVNGINNINIIHYSFIFYFAIYMFPKNITKLTIVLTISALTLLGFGQQFNFIQPAPSTSTPLNTLISILFSLIIVFVFMYSRNKSKLHTEELIKQEAKIQRQTTLLDQVSEAIISLDINHHVTSWNPAAEKIYGWTSSEVSGKFITDLIPTTVINHSPYALEKEDDYRVETTQLKKDGTIIHISSSISPHLDSDGNMIGTVIANRDISKRYKVQQALIETTERLDSLISNMPALIGYADKDGVIRFLNDFHTSFGLNPADLNGMVYVTLFSPDEQAIIKPQIEKVFTGERAEFEMFIEILDTRYFMEIVIIPHEVDRTVDGFCVMAIDRTERLKALEALLDNQKIDSLGMLAGGIAHDFNNLLSVIMMQGSLAQKKLPQENPVQDNLSSVMNTAERAAMLAKQMLAYSGRGQTEVKTCNLNDIIHDSVRLFQASIKPQINLSLNLSQTLPLVEVDWTQIQQVVLNLLWNASDAVGKQHGEIQIKTGVLTIHEDEAKVWQYTGESAVAGEFVCLAITDNGTGIDAETLQKIFDPFFTTKDDGTGLGLAAVLGIVRGHGGGVEVKSAVNQATTFNIFLPTQKLPEKS